MAPKTKAANGTAASAPAPPKPAPSPAPSGTATPAADKAEGALAKPDKAAYDAEQDRLRKEIDALQAKLNAVKDKIGGSGKGGEAGGRRAELRAELDGLRATQAGGKSSRGKIFDELKAVQERVQAKVKALNAQRGKTPFKSVADVDAHIRALEKQVESGSMKLADEKRALQEISQTKRARKTVEGFQAEEDAIAGDRARIEALKAQLDDPALKAAGERFDALKAELDALKKEDDAAWANRNALFDERNALKAQLDALFKQKHDSVRTYREAGDRYYAKVQEDRARRAERYAAQRAAENAERKKAQADEILAAAKEDAYEFQIKDCQVLIDYFSGGATGAPPALSTDTAAKVGGAHDLRTVEAPQDAGFTVLKKKADNEDVFFAGAGKGKKGRRGAPAPKADEPAKDKFNVPFATLSALLSLSIPPPASSADVPRVIGDLKIKQQWFKDNNDRVTKANIAKAQALVDRLNKGESIEGEPAPGAAPSDEPTPPNGGAERPAEPASTPAVDDAPKSFSPPSAAVEEKLEQVEEEQAADA